MNTVPLCLIVATLLCAGCGNGDRDALTTARRTWALRTFQNYHYTFHWSCFCYPTFTQKAILIIAAERVVSAKDADTGSSIDLVSAPREHDYRSVSGLFDWLDESLNHDPDHYEVVFDPQYGYPKTAAVDLSIHVADDETSFDASDLTADP